MRLCVTVLGAAALAGSSRPNGSSAALRPYHLIGNSTIHRGSDSVRGLSYGAQHVPLLVLIFTVRPNSGRRADQQRTWLTHPWRTADNSPVPWRYVYVLGRKARSLQSSGPVQDELVGDRVFLGRIQETYLNLVHKTLDSLRWAVSSVSFDVLLKTDDDSMLHVSRLWSWLSVSDEPFREMHVPTSSSVDDRRAAWRRLYAGRVQIDSQTIRSNFTKKDLWYPHWFPDDFLKWAIPYSSFSEDRFPPYCSGGGYLLGRDAAGAILSQYRLWKADVFPIEDAFLGVLARAGGIAPTEMGPVLGRRPSLFEDPAAQQAQVRALFAGKILVHRVKDFDQGFKWMLLNVTAPLGTMKRKGTGSKARPVLSAGRSIGNAHVHMPEIMTT